MLIGLTTMVKDAGVFAAPRLKDQSPVRHSTFTMPSQSVCCKKLKIAAIGASLAPDPEALVCRFIGESLFVRFDRILGRNVAQRYEDQPSLLFLRHPPCHQALSRRHADLHRPAAFWACAIHFLLPNLTATIWEFRQSYSIATRFRQSAD